MLILGIESSCDETAAAVVRDARTVCSNVIDSQVDRHKQFGGVVPEIASRCHIEAISGVCARALDQAGIRAEQLDAVAVTAAPGLIGALLVGVNFAKGLSYALDRPLIPVHHIRGHVAANYLAFPALQPPFLALVVSGGHSHIVQVEGYTRYRIVGQTRDDAAGEAFDKVARVLGLGYPGGPAVERMAKEAGEKRYLLPEPKLDTPYDFSFSGLKTAVINLAHHARQTGQDLDLPGLAASFQSTVASILTARLFAAAEALGSRAIVLAGGVSANGALRQLAAEGCARRGLPLYMPPLALCGDNAAMIAAQGYYEWLDGARAGLSLNARPTMSIEAGF